MDVERISLSRNSRTAIPSNRISRRTRPRTRPLNEMIPCGGARCGGARSYCLLAARRPVRVETSHAYSSASSAARRLTLPSGSQNYRCWRAACLRSSYAAANPNPIKHRKASERDG
jgi:hypothetical protein